ncbi:DNA cytosine methyltransferase [Nocardiopsis nanhaiensis]
MITTTRPHAALATATQELRIGSLCTGYAGLDMGVAAALGGNAHLAWVADNDPDVEHLLTHRYPGVCNLGDITTVTWEGVDPVDVLTAGWPCQDISIAGRGDGIEKGDRSGVWFRVMDALRQLRPQLVVLENVLALRGRNRGFDRVLADLAQAGYDARWRCVRACDIGAPHRRERVFVVAHPRFQRRVSGPRESTRAYAARTPGASVRRALPPARHIRARTHPLCAHHQQCPHTREIAAHTTCERSRQRKSRAEGFARQPQLALRGHRYNQRQQRHPAAPPPAPFAYAWADYEPAIRHWEKVFGRAAPAPTEVGTRGQPRLSDELVEWMMGLPHGWVTAPELGIPRRAQLQALGNGVVPQQAAAAVRHLLAEMAYAEGGGAAWD